MEPSDLLRPWFKLRVKVAVSGGSDSLALLLLVASERAHFKHIRAEYLDHGWGEESKSWGQFVAAVCQRHGVEFTRVDLPDQPGRCGETEARDLRYSHWEGSLETGEVLLQGHTQDDQAETVLSRLLRGTGAYGLAGIPAERALGRGALGRPLLSTPRAELQEWLTQRGEKWLSDPSNSDQYYLRSWLRTDITPRFSQRFPHWQRQVAELTRAATSANQLLDEVAQADWKSAHKKQAFAGHHALDIDALPTSDERLDNLLRWWVHRSTGDALPRSKRSQCSDLLAGSASLAWQARNSTHWVLRGWRDALWLYSPKPPLETPQVKVVESTEKGRVVFSCQGLDIALTDTRGTIAKKHWEFEVRCGTRGLRLNMPKRPKKTAARLLADAGVPPWLRADALVITAVQDPAICYLEHVGWSQEAHTAGCGGIEVAIEPT